MRIPNFIQPIINKPEIAFAGASFIIAKVIKEDHHTLFLVGLISCIGAHHLYKQCQMRRQMSVLKNQLRPISGNLSERLNDLKEKMLNNKNLPRTRESEMEAAALEAILMEEVCNADKEEKEGRNPSAFGEFFRFGVQLYEGGYF